MEKKQKELEPTAGLDGGAKSASCTQATPGDALPEVVVDTQALDALREIQPGGALVARVVGLYLGEMPKYGQSLDDAVSAGDVDAVMRAAHTLKSASGNVGLLRVAALARALELDARRADLSRAESLWGGLRNEMAAARLALEAVLAATAADTQPKG